MDTSLQNIFHLILKTEALAFTQISAESVWVLRTGICGMVYTTRCKKTPCNVRLMKNASYTVPNYRDKPVLTFLKRNHYFQPGYQCAYLLGNWYAQAQQSIGKRNISVLLCLWTNPLSATTPCASYTFEWRYHDAGLDWLPARSVVPSYHSTSSSALFAQTPCVMDWKCTLSISCRRCSLST